MNTTENTTLKLAVKAGNLEDAKKTLESSGVLTYGIEHVSCGDVELHYVNLGDTYSTTICQEDDGSLFISSWGAWYELTERQQNNNNNTITCAWCSHRTPVERTETCNISKVIRFIVALLDDDNDISDDAMQCLRDLDYDDRIADIINQCECCDGRWYLPRSAPVLQ